MIKSVLRDRFLIFMRKTSKKEVDKLTKGSSHGTKCFKI
jgi:hypothetical protein